MSRLPSLAAPKVPFDLPRKASVDAAHAREAADPGRLARLFVVVHVPPFKGCVS